MENPKMKGWQRQSWLRYLLQKSGKKAPADAGITLLECLIAIAVIGITAGLILPPLFLATGTRVQNRRAEQAFQLAQEEINRLQTMTANGVHEARRLPDTVTAEGAYFDMGGGGGTVIADVAPPTGEWGANVQSSGACDNYDAFNPSQAGAPVDIPPANRALRIDVDGNCADNDSNDFYMQVFRDFGTYSDFEVGQAPNANQRRPSVYRAVVRVYSAVAARDWGRLVTPVVPASLQLTRGEGNQGEYPLAIMNTLIVDSGTSTSSCTTLYHTAQEKGETLPNADRDRCRGDVAQIP
ncbi:prepilin-type N-terminal cleavage/methylation domain-containing protein [Vacuolonema iberomarrocanum]|uniref:prepilin-type N-terminal cleavage/methylation domain-containing protein n=1 Tax=Vacuolonema iberomarrocanum TaxID=3454632 RepID=UPI0019DDC5FD|nr:type II secretion system protein [filamentous cyanobacterium LEGE 07170]